MENPWIHHGKIRKIRKYGRRKTGKTGNARAGARQTVEFAVPVTDLKVVLPDLCEVVEPGEFDTMVGPSSRDSDLLKSVERISSLARVWHCRSYLLAAQRADFVKHYKIDVL